MLDAADHLGETEILPARKLAARVAGTFVAPFDHFVTRATEELRLGFEGIEGDFHAGYTRRSGGREPWYPRGTEMRNERQLSIVAPDELALIAERMDIAELKPEWIGANLLHGGRAAPLDAALGNHAVFQRRRDAEGGQAERSVPVLRPLHRRTCEHAGS